MKYKFILFAGLLTLSAVLVGCINTVSGQKTAGVPWLKDRAAARYERTLDQVFNATKVVLARNGTIGSAGSIFSQTNDVRVIEGKVKQNSVYVRMEAIEPRLTQLTIQIRTSGGGTDKVLAHQLDKEIALELTR